MAKNKYRVIITEKVEKHYEVEAENPVSAGFAVAASLASATPIEPVKSETVSTGIKTALVGGKADTLEVPAG